MSYRFQKEVTGVKYGSDINFKILKLMVRGTADGVGKTLSIADEVGDIMLEIPLEPIMGDLKKMIKE